MVSVFARFAPRLQEAIVARLGWSSLRPAQELAGEAMLAGFEPDIWDNQERGQTIADSLPAYRLSRFQPLMPDWVEREVVSNDLLDLPAARQWLTDRAS